MSPYLFNIFIEEVVKEFNVKFKGIQINGKVIHCIIFTDGIAMVTVTAQYMQQLLVTFSKILNQYLMKIGNKDNLSHSSK